MDRQTLDKIQEMSGPHVVEVNGENYCDVELYKVGAEPLAEPIKAKTLTSIIDYIRKYAGYDVMDVSHYLLHVVSPTRVDLISCLNDDKKREVIFRAVYDEPAFSYDTFYDNEKFTIAVQAFFVDSNDRSKVLKFAGTVSAGTIREYGDDGVTQKATIRTGIKTKDEAKVPSPCVLRPYRTFTEVEQPASQFIFRMREGREGVESALFTADGGAWKLEAMKNIKAYLEDHLTDEHGEMITVIM